MSACHVESSNTTASTLPSYFASSSRFNASSAKPMASSADCHAPPRHPPSPPKAKNHACGHGDGGARIQRGSQRRGAGRQMHRLQVATSRNSQEEARAGGTPIAVQRLRGSGALCRCGAVCRCPPTPPAPVCHAQAVSDAGPTEQETRRASLLSEAHSDWQDGGGGEEKDGLTAVSRSRGVACRTGAATGGRGRAGLITSAEALPHAPPLSAPLRATTRSLSMPPAPEAGGG